MSWGAVAGAAVGVVGGALSGGGKSGSQSTTQEVDPRLAKYLYGEDGEGGLLADVSKWYQANKSGLNDQMAQGLNTQWNVYNDPRTLGGYQQMSNLGSGLMSTPVVGNPFADGRLSLGGGAASAPNLGMGGSQPQAPQRAPISYGMPASAQQAMPAAPGPFTSAQPAYQTAAPAPAPVQSSGWEDLFNPNKQPVLSWDKDKKPFEIGTNWAWNGSMWAPQRLEQGGP
jgi:hypothetical protein